MFRRLIPALLLGAIAAGAYAGAAAPTRSLPRYESRYYVIYTDLPLDSVREADLRMSRMVEEYSQRTRGFSGVIRQKFPFYLFRHERDYNAFGGIEGTAGVFDQS